MSNALIDAIHYNVSHATEIAYFLQSRSRALRIVGMKDLADDLEMIGHDMVKAAKGVSDAFNGDLAIRLRESQDMTGALLLATMKGCFVPPKARSDAEAEE